MYGGGLGPLEPIHTVPMTYTLLLLEPGIQKKYAKLNQIYRKGELNMKELNWNAFLTNILTGAMLNKNSEYYWKNLTLERIRDILITKSDMFIGCFWHALSLARKDSE